MPPAFNLSQDQTLKFNPQHSLKADMSAQSLRYSTTQRAALSQQTKHPHLSIVQIFKEPLKKKAPSAQKRNSPKNRPLRQPQNQQTKQSRAIKKLAASQRRPNYRQQKDTVNETKENRHNNSVIHSARKILKARVLTNERHPNPTRRTVAVLAAALERRTTGRDKCGLQTRCPARQSRAV